MRNIEIFQVELFLKSHRWVELLLSVLMVSVARDDGALKWYLAIHVVFLSLHIFV